METLKLIDYLKQQGAIKAAIMQGPNGDFISATKADDTRFTLPVGKNSQGGRLAEMNVLITEDKQDPTKKVAIATMNNYSVAEELSLV